jgi:hypothetical protein
MKIIAEGVTVYSLIKDIASAPTLGMISASLRDLRTV